MPNPSARALPFMVGRYECKQYLGGGMCDVYKASDTQYGRSVVIKMLKHGAPADMRTRFEREARVSMKVQHENAMVTYDFAEHEGQLYLVLEYLEGESLRDWLKQPHAVEEKTWVALQVAKALDHVHSLDIVYRDLKPENIHVGANTKVKLMDFGIARSADVGLTEAGMAIGTAPYMAPEQVRGENLTASADIYAFGILLYEFFTAKRPFEGASYEAIFGQILFSPPNLEPLEQNNVPKPLVDMIRTCLQKTPAQRYESMKPIVTLLQGSISDKFFSTMVLGTAERPARPFPKKLVVSLVLVLGVAAAAAGYFMSRPKPQKPPPAAELHLPSGDMALIPGGLAPIGENGSKVDIPSFYLDKTEVSNAAFNEFCKQTGCTSPRGNPDDPVVNVTFDEASKFAQWANKRLPTEPEWEKAARGPNGFRFPWGDSPDSKRANVTDNPDLQVHQVMPVNSFPSGKSPYGMLNMSGNVWEWTSTQLVPIPEAREGWKKQTSLNPPLSDSDLFYALKGGSYQTVLANPTDEHQAVPMFQDAAVPGRAKGPDIGFRCAKDAQ